MFVDVEHAATLSGSICGGRPGNLDVTGVPIGKGRLITNVLTTRWPDTGSVGRWSQRIRCTHDDLPRGWADFLGGISWVAMVTATFDPKRVFPVGVALASREAWQWCSHLGWLTRRPVGWLYVTERGRGGLWHAHVLVAGITMDVLQVAAAMWTVRNGHAHLQNVSDPKGAVAYVTKDVPRGAEVVLADTLDRYLPRVHS
jgi:hypothetical protein